MLLNKLDMQVEVTKFNTVNGLYNCYILFVIQMLIRILRSLFMRDCF